MNHFQAISTIRSILWPAGNENQQWSPDTIQEIADIIGQTTDDTCLYLLQMHGDIEPELHGPFPTVEERDARALELRRDDPEMENGLFRVSSEGAIDVTPFSGGELLIDDESEGDAQ